MQPKYRKKRKIENALPAVLSATVRGEDDDGREQTRDDRCCAHVDGDGTRCANVATSILGAGSTRRGYCRLHVGLYEN